MLFLGNSLIQAGIDTAAFARGWPAGLAPETFAAGLGASTPAEHRMVLQEALAAMPELQQVVYGYFDDQLYAPVSGHWEQLIGNRAYSYRHPALAARYYAPGSRVEALMLGLVSVIPMLRDRTTLWTKVELLRRAMGAFGLPAQQQARFGRADDFNGLEAADVESFQKRTQAAVEMPTFTPALEDALRLAEARRIEIILVEMPMPSRHRERFYSTAQWKALQVHTRDYATARGLGYVAASEWIADDGFEDPTHLSPHGAQRFSERLARELAAVPSPR